ncbi:MAG: hypothetical protein AB7N24_11060 [Dehalococcoidia bacterium]
MKSPTTSARRGFRRERHSRFKVVIASVATAGFLGGWLAFAAAHPALPPAESEPAEIASAASTAPQDPTAPTSLPTSAVRTGTPVAGAAATPTQAAAPADPDPAVTRTPRRSRGS